MPYSDKDKQREAQRINAYNRNRKNRYIVIQFLGGNCAICSFDDIRCLQIDHISPLLRAENERWHKTSTRLVDDILADREDLSNLQLLCANCHREEHSY